jgi:hypothetical protein
MAEKIRVIKQNASTGETADGAPSYLKSDTFEVDLDKFFHDYRRAIFSASSDGSVIGPTDFLWKSMEENKV